MFAQGNHGDNVHEACMGGGQRERWREGEKYESNYDYYYI